MNKSLKAGAAKIAGEEGMKKSTSTWCRVCTWASSVILGWHVEMVARTL